MQPFVYPHRHKGIDAPQISLMDLRDTLQTVSAVPTGVPTTLYEQLVICAAGTTYRLLAYDTINSAWLYISATH